MCIIKTDLTKHQNIYKPLVLSPLKTLLVLMLICMCFLTFSLSAQIISSPEIDIQGNGITIVDGDTIPQLDDNTNFGSHTIGASVKIKSFEILNDGTADLILTDSPAVTITGSNDFSIDIQPVSTIAETSFFYFDYRIRSNYSKYSFSKYLNK